MLCTLKSPPLSSVKTSPPTLSGVKSPPASPPLLPNLKRSASGTLLHSKRVCTPPPPTSVAAWLPTASVATKRTQQPILSESFAPFGAAVAPAPTPLQSWDTGSLREKHQLWQTKLAEALKESSAASRALVGKALQLPPLGAAVALCRLQHAEVELLGQRDPPVHKIVADLRQRAVKLLWHNPRLRAALERLPAQELHKMGLTPLLGSPSGCAASAAAQ